MTRNTVKIISVFFTPEEHKQATQQVHEETILEPTPLPYQSGEALKQDHSTNLWTLTHSHVSELLLNIIKILFYSFVGLFH